MDPSATLCRKYDSLLGPRPQLSQLPPELPWFGTKDNQADILRAANPLPISTSSTPDAVYCERNTYARLQTVKASFTTVDPKVFQAARNKANPFENIGKSIFMNRAAVKLANVDAVYPLTGATYTLFQDQVPGNDFLFCDVAGGPGSFTEYIQYRRPGAKGYGITLRAGTLDWNRAALDLTNFNIFYSNDSIASSSPIKSSSPPNRGTGDLYVEWDNFIQYVTRENKVDLVVADGGIDVEEENNFQRQEFLSSRLILIEAYVAIRCLRPGGKALIKFFDTVTEFSGDLLYLISQAFTRISFFKPVSSRPANAEKYLICEGRLGGIETLEGILRNAILLTNTQTYLARILNTPLPTSFTTWLTQQNNSSINAQVQAVRAILRLINDPSLYIESEYIMDKFLKIWNLPDTPTDTR